MPSNIVTINHYGGLEWEICDSKIEDIIVALDEAGTKTGPRNWKLMTADQLKQLDLNAGVLCRSSSLKCLSQIVDTGFSFPVDIIEHIGDNELVVTCDKAPQFPNFLSQLKSIMEAMPDAKTKAQFKLVLDSDSVEELHKFAGGLDVLSKKEIWPPEEYPEMYVKK